MYQHVRIDIPIPAHHATQQLKYRGQTTPQSATTSLLYHIGTDGDGLCDFDFSPTGATYLNFLPLS